MKRLLLQILTISLMQSSWAQYSSDFTFGNATGYTFCEGLNPNGNTGTQTDICKRLIARGDGSGNLLAVGSMRYSGNGDDLDLGFFLIGSNGQELGYFQYGTGENEHLQDAIRIGNTLYFCGNKTDVNGSSSSFIGSINLLDNNVSFNALPLANQSATYAITTDGNALYFCGVTIVSGNYTGFVYKTDLSFAPANGFGFGGWTYPKFNSNVGHDEYLSDILYSASENAIYVAGSQNADTWYKGGILKLSTSSGNNDPAFSAVSQAVSGEHVQFNAFAESPTDHSIIVVGQTAPSGPVAPTGMIAKYSSNGNTLSQPSAIACTEINEITIANNRIVATGNKDNFQYIYSMLLDSYTADSDFNTLENLDHFYTDYITVSGNSLTGNSTLFQGDTLYVGGTIGDLGFPGNSAFSISKYTSNKASVQLNNATDKFSTSPNPFNESVTIQLKTNSEIIAYRLYDMKGAVSLNQNTIDPNKKSLIIETKSLNSGIYFLTIETNEGTFTEKICKQ